MTEVYKFVNGIGPSFMSELFKMATEKYNVRTKHRLLIPSQICEKRLSINNIKSVGVNINTATIFLFYYVILIIIIVFN